MQIEPSALDRWLADHADQATHVLAGRGVRPLDPDRFDTEPPALGAGTPTNGDPALRERLADRYDQRADEILCTAGSREAILLALLTLLDTEDHAVVVTPTTQPLTALPAMLAEMTAVPLTPTDWTLDTESIAEALTPETSVVVLQNPTDPTGQSHTRDTLEAVYDLARDAGAYLLGAESARPLADEPAPPVASLGRYGVSAGGLETAWGLAGVRVGWLAGPPELVQAARNWKDYTTGTPSVLDQHVARQALDREGEIIPENRSLAATNRQRVADLLDTHDLDWPTPVTAAGFVTIPDGFATAHSFCRRLLQETGVLLAPGGVFGHDQYVRLGFGQATDELDAGLERFGGFLDRHA